ncbi:hypothetical protein DICVIV_13507 [Dictyocaulus viviparus]|uniref:Uncharacterized protein n=1 Tax=Dictyocaulus viviparus TaxID=29172 RepID=A0A0D8X9U0_DICVI|nr:hypothetical protein DICVIV_13507 [Dictyocaulus viviparus]
MDIYSYPIAAHGIHSTTETMPTIVECLLILIIVPYVEKEQIIYDYFSNLFGIFDIRLPSYNERKHDYVAPNVLLPKIRHAISSVRNRTAPRPDRISPENLKNLPLPPVLIKTLARLFARYLSECKVSSQWKTSRTVLPHKKIDIYDIRKYRAIYQEQPHEQAGFRKEFRTTDHIHTITRLIELSREYNRRSATPPSSLRR